MVRKAKIISTGELIEVSPDRDYYGNEVWYSKKTKKLYATSALDFTPDDSESNSPAVSLSQFTGKKMKLKTKIAQILRRWAEKLEPIFPCDVKHIPYLKEERHNIQKMMLRHSIPRYLFDHNPNHMNRLVREEIAAGVAKKLDANGLIKIMIEPTSESVNYTGELYIIDFYKDSI